MKNAGWFTFEGVEYCYRDSTRFLSFYDNCSKEEIIDG